MFQAGQSSLFPSAPPPLHCAAVHGRLEVTKLLLERGAFIEASNQYGATPLQFPLFHQSSWRQALGRAHPGPHLPAFEPHPSAAQRR